jgi:hypothetical protein
VQFRQQDHIEAGTIFEVERIDSGEYRLKRVPWRRNQGLVELLLACPLKGWFVQADRTQSTGDIPVPELG